MTQKLVDATVPVNEPHDVSDSDGRYDNEDGSGSITSEKVG